MGSGHRMAPFLLLGLGYLHFQEALVELVACQGLSMNTVLWPPSLVSLLGPQRHFKRPGGEKLPSPTSTLGYPQISSQAQNHPWALLQTPISYLSPNNEP